mmetsp:Transcript_19087/g.63062  ORF Transcript_19087/g.63062 Transcript_19087/m.63062 type:complete len:222 (+) Transcript_19087:1113-1778(+)
MRRRETRTRSRRRRRGLKKAPTATRCRRRRRRRGPRKAPTATRCSRWTSCCGCCACSPRRRAGSSCPCSRCGGVAPPCARSRSSRRLSTLWGSSPNQRAALLAAAAGRSAACSTPPAPSQSARRAAEVRGAGRRGLRAPAPPPLAWMCGGAARTGSGRNSGRVEEGRALLPKRDVPLRYGRAPSCVVERGGRASSFSTVCCLSYLAWCTWSVLTPFCWVRV